jgi:mono/diheme cytochrome c family protein
MAPVTKVIGVLLAGLVGLIVIAIVVVYTVSSRRIARVYTFDDQPLLIPTDSASIAKGHHFVQAIAKCATCHGDDLAGKVFVDNAMMGRIYSANLTRGKGGIGSSYTAADYVRAIRHGVGKDGRPLLTMPTDAFYYINDEDLANSIAYLKTLSAIDAEIPAKRVGPMARALSLLTDFPLVQVEKVPQSASRPQSAPVGATREYGDYLATTGSCKSCHLQDLSGGVPIARNLLSANLTPTAIGSWSEADFRRTIRDGIRPGGRVLSAVMPWPYTRFMTDGEIHALWLYVHSVPPKQFRGR